MTTTAIIVITACFGGALILCSSIFGVAFMVCRAIERDRRVREEGPNYPDTDGVDLTAERP